MAKKKAPAKKSAKVPNNRLFAYLSYLSILSLVAFILGPRDKFTRFHVRQGLVLFILEAVTIMVMIVPLFLPIALIAWLLWVVLSLMGLFAVMNGQTKPLPLISKYAKNL